MRPEDCMTSTDAYENYLCASKLLGSLIARRERKLVAAYWWRYKYLKSLETGDEWEAGDE